MQQQRTISRSDYNVWWKVDFIWQPAQWLDQEETSKHFPKPNLHQKKVMVTGSLILQFSKSQWNHTSERSILSKSMRGTENRKACSNTGQQKGLSSSPPPHLTTRHATTFQKLNKLGYDVFPHLSYSPDLSPTDYHFYKNLDNFFQGKCFHNQPRVHRIPKHGLLCYRNEKSYFLLAKMCWL